MDIWVEISKKIHKRFSTAVLIRFFFLFLIVFGIVVLLYAHNQTEELKDTVKFVNKLSLHSLEKSVQLRFAAFKLYDDSLNNRLKEAFIPFFDAYVLRDGNIDKMDLVQIRKEMNEQPDMIDLYIINESGVIIATTNSNDLFLNFTEKAPQFADYLDQIRKTKGFFPDEVTGELSGNEVRKWAYMPTPDHKYILEIGLKESTFGLDRNYIMNLSEISSDIVSSNPYINNITFYNFLLEPVGSSSELLKFTPDDRIKKIFNSRLSLTDYEEDIPSRYLFFLMSDRSIYGYESSLVAQVDTDLLYIKKEILSIQLKMLNLFIIVALLSGLLLFITLSRISRPIQEIIQDIDQISQGDLNHVIRDPGIEEFNSLIQAIYRFKDSILSEQYTNQQLTEKNTLLKQIIESIPEPILIINNSHRIIGWNNAMEDLTGFSRSEMIDADKEVYSSIFLSGNNYLIANCILDPTLKRTIAFTDYKIQKTTYTKGWTTLAGQIKPRYLFAVAGPVYDTNGNIIAVIETIRDITALKTTEEALISSEEKYRLIIENSHDIIFTMNLQGEYTYLSPSWEKNSGYKILDTIGQVYGEHIHPDDIRELNQIIQNVITAEKRSDPVQFRIIHAKGTVQWYSSIFNPVRDSSDKLFQISGVAHDITTRKQVEDSLKIALHKLNVLNSITRHDIKNQLTILMGFLHIDKEDLTDPEYIRRNEIERKVGTTIYNQIEFAREYHEIGLHEPLWQDVASVIKRTVIQFSMTNITVDNRISNLEIFADPMVEKVIFTMFENSIRHGGRVTHIQIQAQEKENGLKIIYIDNGYGIMDEEKELIFNHGYGQNTGLGLFLSREILSLTGLTIHESGTYRVGVQFEIFAKKGLYRYVD
ncbi:MAG: PAS domain S-box protein [Methanomicrobiales archaeon]|nr:PAS domain S-box protein [Methanomicrobiales archaeon]